MKMGTRTPWGTADSSQQITKGIMFYTTPSHGGYHLSPAMNAKVHEAWRDAKGWYEEDCEWSIVALTFPEHFSADNLAHAKATAKGCYPHAYKTVTGEDVKLEESHVLREEADAVKHAESWIAVCAMGSWHAKVPSGKVGVIAAKGGRDSTGRLPREQRCFLVAKEAYDAREHWCSLGFIVNPAEHAEVEAFS
jgi:hypothetical protein